MEAPQTVPDPSPEAVRCAQCQVELPHHRAWKVEDREFCEACLRDLGALVRAHFREVASHPDIPNALLWGTAAAGAGAFAWYAITVNSGVQFGVLALGVAWLVGKAVVRGSGHKRGPVLQAISVGLTIGAILFAELAITAEFHKPRTAPIDQLVRVWIRSMTPIGFLIIAFAIYQAWVVPRLPKLQ